jgi:hypothetical protein
VDFVGREVEGSRSCAAGRRPKIVSEAVTCPGLPHCAALTVMTTERLSSLMYIIVILSQEY